MSGKKYRPPQLDAASPVLARLRKLLKDAGYFTAGIAPSLAQPEPDFAGISEGTALDTLVRFLYSQEPIDARELRDALQPVTPEQLLEIGFCRAEGKKFIANVYLQPYRDWLFASGQFSLKPRPEELMMLISSSSLEVANLMVPRPCSTALDLGTGCGFLAALATQNTERVYAVDVNATAVRFAEFNARWNGLTNVTCLQGSLFEPVRGTRFDLIVSNPPYYICPVPASSTNQLLFQHSGGQGDSFCIQLARDAAPFLEEGGFFHMGFSWLEVSGQDWRDKLTASFSGLNCDAWVLRTAEESAGEYVMAWSNELAEIGKVKKSELESLRQEGIGHFQKSNICSVGSGLLTLRRCSTRRNVLWFDEAPEDRNEPYGSSVAAIFDIRERYDVMDDETLLRQRFKIAPEVVAIQKSSPHDGSWQNTASEFGRESGLKYTFSGVEPFVYRALPRLDGKLTLRQVLERGAGEAKLPLESMIAKYLPSLRELLRYGFLLPAATPPTKGAKLTRRR